MNDEGSERPAEVSEARPLAAMNGYLDAIEDLIEEVRGEQPAIRRAAHVVAACLGKGGQVFVFGTGHSHIVALDAFFRAGGLAPVCPVLDPRLMLFDGAVESTRFERVSGLAVQVLERYEVDPSIDCLVVISNSGTNAVPTEMVSVAKEMGMPVISISSFAYAIAICGDRGLAETADVAVDNHCPPGDAMVTIHERLPQMAPGSTIAAASILHSILLSAAEVLVESGTDPPLLISANMPGAAAHNAELIERYRPRNPHL
jgi:uncharacterized phosphosugar-binding protein